MNYKSFILALESIESDRNIDKEIVIESLREALEKAYRKHIDNPDALVDVVFNDNDGSIDIFQKTAYMTKRQPARRWGVGVTAGYGIGKHGLSPYVGIGGFYRIW